MSGDLKGGGEGDFHLEDCNRRGIHLETLGRRFRDRGICPAADGNGILAALVDSDEGAAGRLCDAGDQIDVDRTEDKDHVTGARCPTGRTQPSASMAWSISTRRRQSSSVENSAVK